MSRKSWMGKGFYRWLRQLHLYFGVFICPFLLIFAVSTIMLNHGAGCVSSCAILYALVIL